MDIEAFRAELSARGGECSVWLVYVADLFEELQGARTVLDLQGGFFTRGAAYSLAEGRREARRWQHYYVFRVQADPAWVASGLPRRAVFETTFGRPRELPDISVTPTALADAIRHG